MHLLTELVSNSNVKSAIALMWGNVYIYRQGSGNSNAFYIRINLPSQLKIVLGERGRGRGRGRGGECRLISRQKAARIELHGRIKRNIRIIVFLVK